MIDQINKTKVIVPWHDEKQLERWKIEWEYCPERHRDRVIFVQDACKQGCARTKNEGIQAAIAAGAEIAIVIDDDCFPVEADLFPLENLIHGHLRALEPQMVTMFSVVTAPPSRGTPYFDRAILMPVAASMGFWTEVGDYDAPSQLAYGATHPMQFVRDPVYGRYFPLCGMNLAFRTAWWPWCQFVDVPRFDDIWQGFMWQKEAYAEGFCFNLGGPLVRHSRQSNVWRNLEQETPNLERNEKMWKSVHLAPRNLTYEKLRVYLSI